MKKAEDCVCHQCGERAVAFFPAFDPDICSYPYCRTCLDKEKITLLISLTEIDKEYEKSKDKYK